MKKDDKTIVTLSATAYVKYQYFCHSVDVEVSAFGITKENDPLYIEDIALMKQEGAAAETEPTEEGLADFHLDMLAKDIPPTRCMRMWLHTHPAMSATPSGTDWSTFDDVFGQCDYGLMMILSKTGDMSCHLRRNVAPLSDLASAYIEDCKILVDWADLEAIDPDALFKELFENVTEMPTPTNYSNYVGSNHQYNNYRKESSHGGRSTGLETPLKNGKTVGVYARELWGTKFYSTTNHEARTACMELREWEDAELFRRALDRLVIGSNFDRYDIHHEKYIMFMCMDEKQKDYYMPTEKEFRNILLDELAMSIASDDGIDESKLTKREKKDLQKSREKDAKEIRERLVKDLAGRDSGELLRLARRRLPALPKERDPDETQETESSEVVTEPTQEEIHQMIEDWEKEQEDLGMGGHLGF